MATNVQIVLWTININMLIAVIDHKYHAEYQLVMIFAIFEKITKLFWSKQILFCQNKKAFDCGCPKMEIIKSIYFHFVSYLPCTIRIKYAVWGFFLFVKLKINIWKKQNCILIQNLSLIERIILCYNWRMLFEWYFQTR